MNSATHHDVQINGRRLRYWEFHPDRPQTMIILHGFRGNHRGLMPVAELLEEYRIILPDLPGYGESAPLQGTHDFAHYADVVIALSQKLKLKRYILAGHSYGAALAIVTAAKHPKNVDRVVLIEPVMSAATITGRLGELYYAIGAQLPQPLQRWWIKNAALNRLSTELMTTLKNSEQKKKLVRDEQLNVQFIIEQVEIESFLGYYHIDFFAEAKDIPYPTLVIAGQRDQMTPMRLSRKLAGVIPHASFSIIPKAGHFLPMEDPASLARAIRAFLTSAR